MKSCRALCQSPAQPSSYGPGRASPHLLGLHRHWPLLSFLSPLSTPHMCAQQWEMLPLASFTQQDPHSSGHSQIPAAGPVPTLLSDFPPLSHPGQMQQRLCLQPSPLALEREWGHPLSCPHLPASPAPVLSLFSLYPTPYTHPL